MKTLNLRGEELRCIEKLPPGLVFDLAEASSSGDATKALVAFARFLRSTVVPDDRERLNEILYDTESVIELEELNEAAGELITEYTGRPTKRPSQSPTGSNATGGLSRVDSPLPDTDREAVMSSTDGQSGVF